MNNNCCITEIEPCHTNNCDGFDEVVALLPSGQLWNPDRNSVYGRYIKALGHIKTELNKVLCEIADMQPCSSRWMFDYWAKVYKLPPCVEQTPEKLCEWLEVVFGNCPIGTLGFLRKAISFVNPNLEFDIRVNVPDAFANGWRADNWWCADNNAIVITAPATAYRYFEIKGDYPHELPDGANACRRYYIPEVECLRPCIFPIGLSVGYKTKEQGNFDINHWEIIEKGESLEQTFLCKCGATK